MIVDEVRHRCGDRCCELSGRVRSEAWSKDEFTLWYRVPAELAPDHGSGAPDSSPFLTALLLWCMRRSERLRIEGAVSERLLDHVPLAADVVHAFWPDLMTPIEVSAQPRVPGSASSVVASFFTRGVDSWYSALTHGRRPYDGPPVTHLVYVPSVDFMLDDAHLARSIQATADAARAIGRMPVVVETNLRRHTEPFLHWGYYHGAGLASIGLALGVCRMLIPGARSYGFAVPDGSHPLLDSHWSTERTEVVHHGAEATRWDKVEFLADVPQAMAALKVCFDENTDGNCGRCSKCLVTMVMLHAMGVLGDCPFDVPMSPARVARLDDLPTPLVDLLRDEVAPRIDDRQLAVALRAAFLRRSVRGVLRDARAGLGALRTAHDRTPRRSIHEQLLDALHSSRRERVPRSDSRDTT